MTIAKRQRVLNLREIWPKETDFSNWLVGEDGLALIAEDIGVEIEDPRRECRLGDFPCDVVAQKLGDEAHQVVIENQFGKTDHDHLGKMLTYAAMNSVQSSAVTAIWLSEKVSGDHRTVIDWLNENTPPKVSFYLAEIKAYRIGESPVAPQLDVVCRPNLDAKVQLGEKNSELKENHVWRKKMWEEVLGHIASKKPPFRVQSPGIDHYSVISLGRSGFQIALNLTPKRKCVGCELYFSVPWKGDAFAQLEAHKESIEQDIGASLQWQPLPGKKAARILLEVPIDPKDPANREQVKQWMHEQSVKFFRTFQARVKQLKAPSTETEADTDE